MFTRTKTRPSHYPFLPFHGLRCAQALGSLVVAAIMSYFIWNLVHEDFRPPKTFWTLLAAALLGVIFLIGSLFVHLFHGLSPKINLCLNGILLGLWAPGFAFLWYYSRGTLSHVCNVANWNEETGIMVCRIYKALFAFALLGLVSTLGALILDFVIFRRTISRGKYSQMGGEKLPGIAPPYVAPQYSDSRGSIALEGYSAPATHNVDQPGYEVPEEQFSYDTSYQGGHEPAKPAT